MKFDKACWPHALTRKERLGILMLQVHLRKEHAQKCRKMGLSSKAPVSTVSTTVASIFRRKRALVQSVWDKYVKEDRVTVKALP